MPEVIFIGRAADMVRPAVKEVDLVCGSRRKPHGLRPLRVGGALDPRVLTLVVGATSSARYGLFLCSFPCSTGNRAQELRVSKASTSLQEADGKLR